jgi:heme A synthase
VSTVAQIHGLIAWALVLYCAAVGVWGLFLAVRRSPLPGNYAGALAIAVILGVVQALVGVVLVVLGLRPRDDLHYLYGLSVIVAFPLVQQFISTRKVSRPLAYGLAALFVMGLAIRGITTGSP